MTVERTHDVIDRPDASEFTVVLVEAHPTASSHRPNVSVVLSTYPKKHCTVPLKFTD